MSSTDLAIDSSTAAGPGHPGQWMSLRLLNSYRLFVALVLLLVFLSPVTDFGRAAPLVFYGFSSAYLIAGLLFALLLLQRQPQAITQAYLHFFTDVVALSGVTYASGGADSGLGILLLVPVAGAGILLPTRDALVYAALAALMALTSEVVRHQTLGSSAAD
jgi:two-component system sensor histidine kinase PilS (NtrC family)